MWCDPKCAYESAAFMHARAMRARWDDRTLGASLGIFSVQISLPVGLSAFRWASFTTSSFHSTHATPSTYTYVIITTLQTVAIAGFERNWNICDVIFLLQDFSPTFWNGIVFMESEWILKLEMYVEWMVNAHMLLIMNNWSGVGVVIPTHQFDWKFWINRRVWTKWFENVIRCANSMTDWSMANMPIPAQYQSQSTWFYQLLLPLLMSFTGLRFFSINSVYFFRTSHSEWSLIMACGVRSGVCVVRVQHL